MHSLVAGMSRLLTPSGASAPTTALTIAGSAPTVPASPAPLAQWIALGRHRVRSDLHVRHRIGAWHAVIHEAAGQVLPRFAVVDDLLHQGLAQPLRDAAMDLALEADRVHYGADVVDDDVADDLQRAGIGVDLNLTDMAAIGIGVVVGCKSATKWDPTRI
jgi:hypothetical protein